MDALQIRELVRAATGVVGVLSVYCGYKLFCEIPFAKSRATHVIHGLSGALLALFGMALLIADIHSVSNRVMPQSRATIHETRPAEAGSFTPRLDHQRSAGDWAI